MFLFAGSLVLKCSALDLIVTIDDSASQKILTDACTSLGLSVTIDECIERVTDQLAQNLVNLSYKGSQMTAQKNQTNEVLDAITAEITVGKTVTTSTTTIPVKFQ